MSLTVVQSIFHELSFPHWNFVVHHSFFGLSFLGKSLFMQRINVFRRVSEICPIVPEKKIREYWNHLPAWKSLTTLFRLFLSFQSADDTHPSNITPQTLHLTVKHFKNLTPKRVLNKSNVYIATLSDQVSLFIALWYRVFWDDFF